MIAKLYFNLHRKCLSVQIDGIVESHVATAILSNVTFKVSQAGRLRVLATRRKNVHAFIIGELEFTNPHFEHVVENNYQIATYNPYKYDSFVLRNNEVPIATAKKVLVTGRTIYILEA